MEENIYKEYTFVCNNKKCGKEVREYKWSRDIAAVICPVCNSIMTIKPESAKLNLIFKNCDTL